MLTSEIENLKSSRTLFDSDLELERSRLGSELEFRSRIVREFEESRSKCEEYRSKYEEYRSKCEALANQNSESKIKSVHFSLAA